MCIACLAFPGYCSGKILMQYPADTVIKAMDTLYHLNQHKKEIIQPVYADMLLKGKHRFLQVDVVKVINPQKRPLIFYVYYQYLNKEKILLGSFSLYPADNPGRFIVATNGNVEKEGSIILLLTSPAKIEATDQLEVAVKKITFRQK